MIVGINLGDKVNCLFCKTPFEVKDVKITPSGEIIRCPICGKAADIQFYHMFGEKSEET